MKNSKKILIVSSEFPPQPGGIGNHAYNLALQFTLNGFEVEVLTNNRSVNGVEEEIFDEQLGFRVHRIFQNGRLNKYIKRIQLFTQLLKSFEPNLVIGSGKFSIWLVGLLVRGNGIKKCAIVHGSELQLNSMFARSLVDLSLERMHAIIAVSSFTKGLLSKKQNLKATVISNGFNSSSFNFEERTTKKEGLQLITIGTLSQRKGQHNVIEALPDIVKKHPSVCYHMVGIPADKQRLEKIAVDLNVSEHIKIHGILDQESMVQLLRNCDIFVMLSEKDSKGAVEGFGIALLEANALEIPTIGSLHCGIEDAISSGNSGLLIESNDRNGLNVAIGSILNNKGHYEKEAIEWAKEHEWTQVVKKYIAFLEL